MKISPIIPAVFLCASAFAGSVAVPRLPSPEYLVTEVSTNVNSLSLALRSDGAVREAAVTEGMTRLFADEPLAFPAVPEWNMLEAVARGLGVHGESFAVTHTTYGTRVIWR